MKPDAPDVNAAVVSWIREGGTLIYVGDGSDPFHKIDAWWGQRGYANPAEHLFELAGLGRDPKEGVHEVGAGKIVVWKELPARICLSKELADQYRSLVQKTLADTGITWTYRNDLTLHRGPYVISSVMAESVSDEKKVFTGVYADLMTNDYAIIHEKDVAPDDVTLLFDFSKIEGEKYDVRYYITSEDVRYHSTKTLRLEKMPEFKSTYKMNSWITPQGKDYQEPMNMASSNMAADFFPLSGMMIGHALTAKPYPVSQDEDAAKIITRDTYGGYIAFMSVVLPKVTAGTLFNGTFELDTKAPLKSTHFGEAYRGTAAPVAFKFTYKYTPGPTYFNTIVKTEGSTTTVTAEKVPGKVDECSLIAYLYEVDSYSDYLDGTNINSSEKVILKAAFSSGAQDSFTGKTVNFEPTGNGSFDPTNKKYKIAIVCTPSKEGDAYNGAPDSALWIKSLEITY